MSLDLRNLALFVRIAALGAIGRAGAEFGLSATNASHRIQALEADLGVELLHRTTRAVSLTPDGEVFVEHAKRVLDEAEDARASVQIDARSIKGVVRITASASFARTHIVPFVPEFLKAHPEIHMDLNLSDNIVDIVEQGYDVAFRIGDLDPSSLLARKMDNNPMCLVASPEYLERSGTPTSAKDLEKHVCLPFGRSNKWELRGPDGKVRKVAISGPLTVNHGDAIAACVLDGLGIGHGALWHAGPDLRAGRLVQVLPDHRFLTETKIWAVRPPGRVIPKRVQVFLDFIQEKIRATNQDRYGWMSNT